MKSVFINVKKGMSELGCQVAAKHTPFVRSKIHLKCLSVGSL